MNKRKGKLISLEGPDGAGKSTQALILKEQLEKEGHSVKMMHFPRYESTIGSFIGHILQNDVAIDIGTLQLLYIADQSDFQKELDELLNKGTIVILDRYDISTLAYWKAKTDMLMSVLIETVYNKLQCNIRKPDLTVVFNRKGDITERRDSESLDMLEKDEKITSNINDVYMDITRKLSKGRIMAVVDANDSIPAIHSKIIREVERIIK